MTHSALAASATLVSLAFALCTVERWLDRRRRYEAAWTVSLLLFAAGSAALWWGAALGWGDLSFRLFYLFGAVLNVPVLALGTVELLAQPRTARAATIGVLLFCGIGTGVLLAAPITGPIDPDVLPGGADVFGPLPRVLGAVGSGVGALVVLAGALWSAVRLLGAGAPRRQAGTRRLATGNFLIAGGTLVLSAGGLLNSVLDEMDAFAVSLVAGITVIFAGFLLASSARRASALRLAPPATREAG